ncbi:restriction endonuclease [Sphingomonas bacterium]|uniref:restriction endonuclease n=1 Tax=Sphingomonas bacterium TaxID=1895847 RepID=UPI001575789E|nr:restriction endonuclease [Sphingomonas bacterium]
MQALIIVVVLLALGFWHAERKKAAENARLRSRQIAVEIEAAYLEADAAQAELERTERKNADWSAWQDQYAASSLEAAEAEELLQLFTARHIDTLLIKQRQLTFTDDYGRADLTAFIKELEYFVNKVVPEDIRRPLLNHHGDDAVLMMTSLVRICLLEANDPSVPIGLCYSPEMSGVDFERLVGEKLVTAGAVVQFTPVTGDQGADLLVRYDCRTIVVQCKRSASTVGNGAVQEAHAGCKFYEADEAWVVSDAPFSRSARQLADSLCVRLVNFDQVEAAL